MFESPTTYDAPGERSAGSNWRLTGGTASGLQGGVLTASFGWMFLALLMSALAAFLTLANPDAFDFVANYALLFVIAEFALVIVLSAAINRMSTPVAVLTLFAYAALTGATFAIVLAVFDLGSVVTAFLGAAAIFGAAALYGVVTGRDLTSLGGILFAGLIGLIVASLVNVFVGGDQMSFIVGVVGVVLFTGLTAYDVQRINDGRMAWIRDRENASVYGALSLYLDFVNIFDLLLSASGSRQR